MAALTMERFPIDKENAIRVSSAELVSLLALEKKKKKSQFKNY